MRVISAEFIKSAAKTSDFPKERLPEVAFAGRSNVGKSSLINALVNRKGLAITSSQPGRTRLINFFRINHRLAFVDLPGYGYANAPAFVKKEWGALIEGYFNARDNLKGIILIMDIRRPPEREEEMLMDFLDPLGIQSIIALTKVDKLSGNDRTRQLRIFEKKLKGMPILFSAVTGEGRDELWRAITDMVSY